MRISDLKEYSQRAVIRVSPFAVPATYVPTSAAAQSLTRNSYINGLALTETGPRRPVSETTLGGLGELVQVIT